MNIDELRLERQTRSFQEFKFLFFFLGCGFGFLGFSNKSGLAKRPLPESAFPNLFFFIKKYRTLNITNIYEGLGCFLAIMLHT